MGLTYSGGEENIRVASDTFFTLSAATKFIIIWSAANRDDDLAPRRGQTDPIRHYLEVRFG